jgi:DNA-binding CsgD family transcriptional regulator
MVFTGFSLQSAAINEIQASGAMYGVKPLETANLLILAGLPHMADDGGQDHNKVLAAVERFVADKGLTARQLEVLRAALTNASRMEAALALRTPLATLKATLRTVLRSCAVPSLHALLVKATSMLWTNPLAVAVERFVADKGLSLRQLEVLMATVTSATQRQAAAKLRTPLETLKAILRRIYLRCGVVGIPALIVAASTRSG